MAFASSPDVSRMVPAVARSSMNGSLYGRIRDVRSFDTCERRQGMRPRANAAGNLTRIDPSHQQRVRNERSVTTPRHRLCAHQHDTLLYRQVNANLQVVVEPGVCM